MGQLTLRRILDDGPLHDGPVRVLLRRPPPGPDGSSARHVPGLAATPWLLETFGRNPARFSTFRNRYLRLLRSKARTRHLEELARLARDGDIVLLTEDRDPETSPEAVVLEALVRRFGCSRA